MDPPARSPRPGAAEATAPGGDDHLTLSREPGDRRAAIAAGVVVVIFSFGLGAGNLVLPLLAVGVGFPAAVVGLFAGMGAIAQLSFRLVVPYLLGRYQDRTIIAAASLLMAAALLSLVVSQALVVFIVAHVLHGAARALFWTASQTHAVRAHGSAVRSMGSVSALAGVGMILGPTVAGAISAVSLPLALSTAALGAASAALASLFLRRHVPFRRPRDAQEGRMWRRPGVDMACWSGVTAGGWRSMLSSYVPVVLHAGGIGPALIGLLVAMADVAGIAASMLMRARPAKRIGRLLELGALLTATSLVLLPAAASQPIIAAGILSVGGVGAGLISTLGPALASVSVRAGEQGDAIAAQGTFRAVAQFAAPVGVGVAIPILSLPIAFALSAVVLGLPIVASRVSRRTMMLAKQAT